ncbi:MAG TPA: ATP-dependent DNA helicase RecG [Bacteroidota bacterium]|nr:ATP-dependent DNA helicase RecG [Bacteroidota bacterium]
MKSPELLYTPVRFLKGIGPKRAEVLAGHGIATVRDLLYYYPYGYLDLGRVETIGALRSHDYGDRAGALRSTLGTVRTVELLGRPPRQRLVIVLEDGTGFLQLIFFEGINFLKRAFAAGDLLAASGRVTRFRNQIQIVHPMIDRLSSGGEDGSGPEGFLHTGGIIPKYGSTKELRGVQLHVRGLRKIMREVVTQFLPHVPEILPAPVLASRGLAGISAALESIHFPQSYEALDVARRRLKYEELYMMQLLLAMRRNSVKSGPPGIAFRIGSRLARSLVDSLPFTLTAGQVSVINEITRDMREPRPMNRLLQGDVGSGKTVVALTAALIAVDNGCQAVFMAPTEILAEQHHRTISGYCAPLGVSVRLLTGGTKGKEREAIVRWIGSGEPGIYVGTHALIQEGVRFGRMGLAVIDEQHRFGVSQRLALRQGSAAAGEPQTDLLVMTATPIPRTLSMTLYGDLDVSVIRELPPERKKIVTSLRFEKERPAVYSFLRGQLSEGRQVYIVYPLVDESEKIDLKAATASFGRLRKEVFPEISTGLVHGKMPAGERDAVMAAFKEGAIRILVATTVIEVGIDIPNATVMLVEHAERFGLSQLHQLRGRVGRGSSQSYAILMAPDWMRARISQSASLLPDEGEPDDTLIAVRRLQIMRDTNDGFKIAENDLKLRGPGEFFGTKQSGLPRLRIADLLTDQELLDLARADAVSTVERDPHLRLSGHRHLREVVGREMKELVPLTESG